MARAVQYYFLDLEVQWRVTVAIAKTFHTGHTSLLWVKPKGRKVTLKQAFSLDLSSYLCHRLLCHVEVM